MAAQALPDPKAMTDFARRLAAALLACLATALPARATTYSTDFTDLWWNEQEDGWGVNVVQQGEILFLTFFIYGVDNAARWVVAPAMAPASPQPAGATRFTGELYQTAGPWFGAPFNPGAVTRAIVGTATITFDSPDTATLSYTVGGTPVVKAIRRQAFRATPVSGTYVGGMFVTATGCDPPSFNGATNMIGFVTATQAQSRLTLKVEFQLDASRNGSCTFQGNLAFQGRMATLSQGTFSCEPRADIPNAGTFTMTALDAQRNGFHAAFTGSDQFCTYNGRFGGTRDTAN